jgi:hypothetical protein
MPTLRRSRSRFLVVAALAGLASLAAPTMAAQAAPKASHSSTGGTGGTPAPLSLVSESTSSNPNAPAWCETEDDYDMRIFSGSLSGSASYTEQLCGMSDYYNGVYWDAGGIGLESDVSVVGQLSDLTITAPDGTVHHGVLMGQTTSKGTTTSRYAVCYVPPYSMASNTGGWPLAGGTWQVALSGQISSATWYGRLQMATVSFQQGFCPASEQNLGP